MSYQKNSKWAAFAFLLPNFLGFLIFALLPVLLSFCMIFFNWSLKPAVKKDFVGLRNLVDLLGMQAIEPGNSFLLWLYVISVSAVCVALFGALWVNVKQQRGIKTGGAIFVVIGLGTAILGLCLGAGQGVVISGIVCFVCGLAAVCREEGDWKFGAGWIPGVLLLVGSVGLWLMHEPMWQSYVPRDERFWQYLYNTIYLMLGIPFSICGSLVLALLLNKKLPLGSVNIRIITVPLCLICGATTVLLVWGLGYSNIAVLSGILWLTAALGLGLNVVTFRTIYYLPMFTAGVATMILWKALYNPETGPINTALSLLFETIGWNLEPPKWLASVTWAKPALIIMGIWTAIGGTNMLLYLAALSNVPPTLLEAAEVDGAGSWQKFRHVIWPQLAPTTFFISIISIIWGFQGGFEQARVMTEGGPAGSTTTLSYYIYNIAFEVLDLGYAATIAWILFALIFMATAVNWKFGRELEVGA